MSVILNENMTDDLKLDVIQMLIDKGCDVNWLNYQRETALLIALERIEIDIANLLLDNGAVIYKEGRIFYTEEKTRDMEFFPGMSVSVRRTLKGKIFGYGDVVISNGAGEAGEIVMMGVKRPKKVQKALRNLLAMACTRTANMMSPYKMYPQMYRHVLGGYPAYYYGAMQGQNAKK